MALKSGFFNALNHDRRYDALTVGSMFDGVIHDGVFETYKNHMMVRAVGSGDMRIYVDTGRAWFDHTWSHNDAKTYFTISASHPLLPRIDAVVLEVNNSENVRANSLKILQGTAAQNPARPTLVKSTYVNQYPLAYVRVNAGVKTITQANITNMIGSSATPFAVGAVDHITTDQLLAQWTAEFYVWWNAIRGILSGDPATRLAMEILELQKRDTIKQVTFPASGWTTAGSNSPLTQRINVAGMTANCNPELYSALPANATRTEAAAYNDAFSIIASGSGTTGNGYIDYSIFEPLNRNVTVILKGVY